VANGRHPHFEDRRALWWHDRLADALAAAREKKLRVLVQIGRRSCGGSRALVEKNLAKDEIAEFASAHFVTLAADADALEPELAALVATLPKREPTPLCIYLSSDGRVLLSTAGGRPAAVLLNDLVEAAGKQ
jgi:hypothetical protein